MTLIYDIIIITIIFIVVLIVLTLMRPSWILQRSNLDGRLLDSLNGGKLFAYTVLFTIIIVLVYYLLKMAANGGMKATQIIV